MAPALAPALVGNGNGAQPERNASDPSSWGKVGRNELCRVVQARNSSIATVNSHKAPRYRF